MLLESRVHPRFSVRGYSDVVGIHVLLRQPIRDLSLGGCQLEGPGAEDVGAQTDLVITLPDASATLVLRGQVVYVGAESCGMRFVDLTEDQRWLLRKNLAAQYDTRLATTKGAGL